MHTVLPAKHQLFCKPIEGETKTSSGILLQQAAVERPKLAEVINCGGEVTQFERGETIIYKSYSTTEIKVNGDDYFLVAEEDVLGALVEIAE